MSNFFTYLRGTVAIAALSIASITLYAGDHKPGAYQAPDSGSFKVAFLTDVHLDITDNLHQTAGFTQAMKDVKSRGVDLIIFGGDNAFFDGKGPQDYAAVDSTLTVFRSIAESAGVPVHYTIGNHDRYYYNSDGTRDDAGMKMYEKHLGETTYSFDHKGVHFLVINSVKPHPWHSYYIDDKQLEWIKSDLDALPEGTPVIVSTHVPLQSLYYPAMSGTVVPTDMIDNFKVLWDLLAQYHTIAVLQGHQHLYEEMLSKGLWFVTGGAVCASWWSGDLAGTQEGYLLLTLDPKADQYHWEYIDYGWDPTKSH